MNLNRVNWSVFTGTLFSLAIVTLAVFHSTSQPWIFMNLVGFLIVGGGIFAAGLMMMSFEEVADLSKDVWTCYVRTPEDVVIAITEIVSLAEKQEQDPLYLLRDHSWVRHTMIRDGLELLALGISPEETRHRLELIAEQISAQAKHHSGLLMVLAKLGPGFGLLGTLLGLVVLLQEMGSTGNMDRAGPALAISLLATLYGVIFANMFFQPLSEALRLRGEKRSKIDSTIIDGILMLKSKLHPLQIRDGLRSNLQWKENQRLNELLKAQEPAEPESDNGSEQDQGSVSEAA